MNDGIDEYYMKEALLQAGLAEAINEVPIGAVIVYEGKIISSAFNLRESTQQAKAHAEFLAIEKACSYLGTWRLTGCTLYVTLEPCPMCAGAIIQSRIDRVVFGAHDPKAGCAGSLLNILQDERFNHQTEITSGVLVDECSQALKDFFKKLRYNKASPKK